MSKLIIGAIIGCFLLISAIAFFSFNDDKTDEANVKMLKQIKKVEEKVIDKAIDNGIEQKDIILNSKDSGDLDNDCNSNVIKCDSSGCHGVC